MRTLYWFTRDLRMHDNAALLAAGRSDMLLCVYVVEPRWFQPGPLGLSAMGEHRWRFLWQSLMTLERNLRPLGQRLHIAFGEPEKVLTELIQQHQINQVIRTRQPGTEEADQLQGLQDKLPAVHFQQFETLSLFTEKSLPMDLADLPDTFSQFRKLVEKQGDRCTDRLRIRTMTALPPPPGFAKDNRGDCPPITEPEHDAGFRGGEEAALRQLREYLFVSHGIARYKETRNALDDPLASSRLSPWLANGCLSVREVTGMIDEYEQSETRNDSTYWLWFELLWREYFYWYAMKHGRRLFLRDGVQQQNRDTAFHLPDFESWCQGTTPYPLVNAAMNQLRLTGYISNRARQLVASCLVNELAQDWRYGAAWFEQQLMDYDVASNYGNWQYLAGVGADPRGLRQFNLDKQASQYDPEGHFVARWQGEA